MRLAQDERADLADFLACLTPEQWEAPTLCSKWRVRDVVAHIISFDDLGPVGFVGRFAAGRFNPDQVNQVGVDQYAQLTSDELLVELKGHLRPAGLTARFGGRIGLVDGLIHHQDVRRALGAPREVPRERLAKALPFATVAPPIRAFSRDPWAAPGRDRRRLVHRQRPRRRGSRRAVADGDGRARSMPSTSSPDPGSPPSPRACPDDRGLGQERWDDGTSTATIVDLITATASRRA